MQDSTWRHTFPRDHFFKVIIIAPNQEEAVKVSKQLSGSETDWRGVYRGTYENINFVYYYTWPNDQEDLHQHTIGIDACVLVSTTKDDLNALEEEFKKFPSVNNCVVAAPDSSGEALARKLNGLFALRVNDPTETIKSVASKLLELDENDYNRLREKFDTADKDKSGFMETNEVEALAKQLGVNTSEKEVQQSLMAMNNNLDKVISFQEFVDWWKVGRVFSVAISRIYELGQKTRSIVGTFLDFDAFKKETTNPVAIENKHINDIYVSLDSGKLEDLTTRVQGRVTIGGPKRLDAAKNFLSKFTEIHSYTETTWVNFAVFTKSLTISGPEFLEHLKNFQNSLIEWAEKEHLAGLSTFIRQFVEFRYFTHANSANAYMRVKLDIETILKTALDHLMTMRDWLSDQATSFDFTFKIFSSACLGEMIKNNNTVADFLNRGEVELKGNLLKNRLRVLMGFLRPQFQEILGVFQFFFMSKNFDLRFKGPFDEFINDGSFRFFNESLRPLESFFNFIKGRFNPDVLKSFSRIEITVNLFEIFANLQIFSETLW